MFDLAARRQLNRGYNDGLSRAVEIVGTPLLLGFLGHLLDGWLGIRPAMTIVLGAVGVSGVFVKMWIGYDRDMREHEAGAVWARPRRRVVATDAPPAAAEGAEPGHVAAAEAAGSVTGDRSGVAGGAMADASEAAGSVTGDRPGVAGGAMADASGAAGSVAGDRSGVAGGAMADAPGSAEALGGAPPGGGARS